MKSEQELNKNILDITMKIKNEYPELSKYLTEMPITLPTNVEEQSQVKMLESYYNSLQQIILKYGVSHKKSIKP
jgi:hypothetical protein